MEKHVICNKSKDRALKVILTGLLAFCALASGGLFLPAVFIGLIVVVLSYASGIEFHNEEKQMRRFFSFFGYKQGSFYSYDKYYCLAIKRTRKGFRVRSRSNTSFIDSVDTFYEVFLMGKKHADSIMLYNSKQKKEAIDFANVWAGLIPFPIKKYGKH